MAKPTEAPVSSPHDNKAVDPFHKGVTGSLLCPVAAMLSYLCARGMADGQLFKFADGRVLTRQHFVSAVCEGLDKAGIDSSKYSGSSF